VALLLDLLVGLGALSPKCLVVFGVVAVLLGLRDGLEILLPRCPGLGGEVFGSGFLSFFVLIIRHFIRGIVYKLKKLSQCQTHSNQVFVLRISHRKSCILSK